MDSLHKALSFGGVLSPDEITCVTQQFVSLHLRPGDLFLTPGAASDRIGFVSAGVCQGYVVGEKLDEEKTTYFYRASQFVLDIESFYSNRPTRLGIRAMTACDMLFIDRSHWYQLNEAVPKLFILSKSLTEAALLNKIKDNDFLHFGKARQKYLVFSATRTWPSASRNATLPLTWALRHSR